jgi:uncharacterized protein YbcC (UPF0753/DUF2309 family)
MSIFADSERARLRAQAASAGRILHATWPMSTFVAVNPLGGLEHRPFEQAVDLVGGLLGIRGHLPLDAFRAQHAAGRIADADLDAALRRRLPELEDLDALELDGQTVPPAQALRTDLLHGLEAPRGIVGPRGAGEWCDTLLGTALAPQVDEQVAKWCAAFCDSHQARWTMPGRRHGLFAAWRALVVADPALRRLRLDRARFQALPARAEDAVLDALQILRVPDAERRAELRAQLARLPGWSSHIKWRAEHPDQAPHPADLVDLLAIRLTYEAQLVEAAAQSILPDGTAGLRALVEQRLTAVAAAPGTDPRQRRERAHAVACALDASGAGEDDLEALAALLERLPVTDRGWVWLDAYEWHYRDRLLTTLDRPTPRGPQQRAAAQAVFCIDARSEGLRRHLERRGAYDTYGFAGFFQLVVRYHGLASTYGARLCPVTVTPTKTITEHPAHGAESAAARAIAAERHAEALVHAFHGAKDDLAAPFALAEAAGWVAGPLAAAKTAAPERFAALRARLARRAERPASDPTVTTPDVEEAEALVAQAERQGIRAVLGRPDLSERACERRRRRALDGHDEPLADTLDLTPAGHAGRVRRALRLGYDPDEQTLWAEFALRSFGLVDRFARLVLLAGHGSRTENNAFEAALDCGACGGQHGGPNARIACAMLNRRAVRAGLADRGIFIPADTVFVAAEHDTASDRVTIFDRHRVPASHRADLERLQADLDSAGHALARERATRLPGGEHPHRRSSDWAQVRPEWGLARHAAFIVGPGGMVSGLDLQTRTFLHSYDWRADPDAIALETILTAPGLVIQWINAQYYFATVDPDVLGAGDKTLHNVVGDIGVLQGHAGDLQLGLPWQSVAVGDALYHEPMRALYIVQAPRERVETLIARNDLLKHYFDGAWVALVLRGAPGEPWQRRTTAGEWVPWTPADHAEHIHPAPTTETIA